MFIALPRLSRRNQKATPVSSLLGSHFGGRDLGGLSISERQFPFRVRADLQRAVERVCGGSEVVRFCGVRKEHSFDGIHLAGLLTDGRYDPAVVAPPEYEEVDIGEDRPVRCLKTGLWLLDRDGGRYAVLLSPAVQCGTAAGVRFQVAGPNDEQGARAADALFEALEAAVHDARSYRGKILSLEQDQNYSGQSTGITVHRLHKVDRDQVILPAKTLALLERNVIQFVKRRHRLAACGQATKKGILFYGPPGTGKSHTIHYLAGALEGHTTLLVTAEQVALLDEYMALARLLQPSVVVIEDVDLIARDRAAMHTPGEEVLLNKLLNEMDGLKETADILFILTTNRPGALEAALASRPGRVDQAIEFPLPDEEGREKLLRLYSRGVRVPDDVARAVVDRTEKVSAAFIKELMRRSVQFHLERQDAEGQDAERRDAEPSDAKPTPRIELRDVEAALDEMLFSGGSLNVKLLGGDATAACEPALE